jgi:hypothetical protein
MLECRDIVATGKRSMFGDFYIKCPDGLCGVETDRYEISEEGIEAWNDGKLKWKRPNTQADL